MCNIKMCDMWNYVAVVWWALCSGAMWQSVWCSNIVNIPHPILHRATSWTTPHHAPFHITKAHDTPHLACCSFHPAPHHIPLHAPFHMTWHHISLHQWCGSTCHMPIPYHKMYDTTSRMVCSMRWCDFAKHGVYYVTWRDVECGAVRCGIMLLWWCDVAKHGAVTL